LYAERKRPITSIVTEVSERFGCVVVGDTAVTIGRRRVVLGAEKGHYSPEANIGFAIWGNACLAGERVDALVSRFAADLPGATSPRSAGRDLAEVLTDRGQHDGRAWDDLRGGVHVCGYEAGVPVLFHVHTGAELPARQTPYELHEDYPDARLGVHLRKGYYPMFGALFDGMQQYAAALAGLGFSWPYNSVEDRVSYYSLMVETVSRTLEASRRLPAVGRGVSAFAFNRAGLQVDLRLPRGPDNFCVEAGAMSFIAS
jgi:hypothetical protein